MNVRPILGVGVVLGIAAFALVSLVNQPADYAVSGLAWQVGSATVAGSVTNHTDQGCTAVNIHLTQRDKNDAIVTEDDISAGSVDAGQRKAWSGTLLFLGPKPVGVTTTTMDAEGRCTDRH